ncbi:receptor kinase-like protein Xa21 isoform X2 [Salvia miltiorrhiza]|uniref:receptor kinase-like protein Xa21 isoform X2 n=2 Tax=Salvia miltiorrhiza TaxID=226208 RepID=UPI0025ABF8D6|nr:receptor kinase-like protein Xa21 isoform X2 [Salvia miltiorrhiza]
MGLEGTIAKEIGNLSSLRFVDISNNSINGQIPSEIGLLGKLQGLNLSHNYLSGDIPTSLSPCVQLKMLDLSHNNLTGTVPAGFGNWSQLQDLSLSRNYLTGTVPTTIGNLSNLEVLDFSRNSFYGTVVSAMGQLSSLRILNLQANNLSGEVPQAIFNLSMLEFLSLRENNLSGSLPFSIDIGLPNIERIFLGNIQQRFDLRANRFHGEIPSSISNLSKLITLDLSDNSFNHVPMNLGSLHQLQMLSLEANQLTNNLSNPEQDFLSSLAASKNLRFIQISFNPITGVLPKSLGSSNLSVSLETFKAFSCKILSPIPDEIGNLSSLLWLNLGYNHFTGAIPTMLGGLRSLRNLEIYGNRFHGSISTFLCNLNSLRLLNLAINNLSGLLPSCLGNLSLLREIYMSRNEFSFNIASILWFDKGAINVKNLIALDLSYNQLSGEIPSTISQLENLVRLSLSRNKLKGRIVESFSLLKDLEHLDLSHNNLSGLIPKSLEALSHLNYFDVSFNELRGEIPDTGCFVNFNAEFFVGNKGLCGPIRFEVKKCQSLSMRKRLPYLSFLIVVVIGLILVLRWKFCARTTYPLSHYFPYDIYRRISYQEILRATGNFDEENLIGRGGIGSVYLGTFSDGMKCAIKVFDLDVQDALKSFQTECEILGGLRHRNLVRIITCCSQPDFKALLMTYMPNGDLEKQLHFANCSLDLFTRMRIMTEVAEVIEYLHEYCRTPIVHCDLNPKNILLDEDMVAHVGDFGISKILSQEERMLRSRTLGTIGYIAPEYGSQGLISTTVDVYSYGILLMETFSRRKPTDEMFSGELTLRRWVSESFPDSILQILDNELLDTDGEEARAVFITCLTSAIGLALECTSALPEERPSTRYVLKRMRDVQSRIREIEIKLNDLKMSFLLTDSDREEIRKSARRWRQIRWKAKQRVPILARIPESQEVVNFEPSETESSNGTTS